MTPRILSANLKYSAHFYVATLKAVTHKTEALSHTGSWKLPLIMEANS